MVKKPQPTITVSEQLKAAIYDSVDSRYVIAREANVDEGSLSRFVNGQSTLTLETVDRICQYLNLELVAKKG